MAWQPGEAPLDMSPAFAAANARNALPMNSESLGQRRWPFVGCANGPNIIFSQVGVGVFLSALWTWEQSKLPRMADIIQVRQVLQVLNGVVRFVSVFMVHLKSWWIEECRRNKTMNCSVPNDTTTVKN